ncbi:hypothetical protein PSFL_03020 [Pseudomonas sp. DD1]|uniref:hypothetical protein n=1 Tax=Pseudomonas sp. DD1 TaxID=879558 RepID=UPI0037C8DED7
MTKAIVALIIVLFTKNWRAYAAGETAGFDQATAESLIEGGYAVEYDADAQVNAKKTRPVAPASKPPAAKTKKQTKAPEVAKSSVVDPETPPADDTDLPEDEDNQPPADDAQQDEPEEEKP